ncbi:MAG TPA: hypothetical protein VM118_07760 [Acidobacteriota bacterium]|nr:hypothetical protein [Acidobacteriota bacterium]
MSMMGMRAGRRKMHRRSGQVAVIRREDYAAAELDTKAELIGRLIPLGLMHVQELLDVEVYRLAGARHARKTEERAGGRYGRKPGSMRTAGQKVRIAVPRVRGENGGFPRSGRPGSRALRLSVLLTATLLAANGCLYDGGGPTIPIGPTMVETDKDFLPAWSPDGETVAYITMLFDSLYHTSLRTVSVSTGSITVVREFGSLIIHGLDWSPDGEWLVFSSILGVYKVSVGGDSLVQLTSGEFHAFPSWSAISNRIFFAKNVGAERGVYSMRPDGTDLARWTWPDSFVVEWPSCFPYSDTLSVYTTRGTDHCLAVYHPGDTVITAILKCGFSWFGPSRVSPDGSLIAFNAAYRGGPGPNLYLFNREDQSVEQLNTKASEGMDFSPDGSQLVHADLGIVYEDPRYADHRGTRGLQIINLADRSVRQLTPGYQ